MDCFPKFYNAKTNEYYVVVHHFPTDEASVFTEDGVFVCRTNVVILQDFPRRFTMPEIFLENMVCCK
jgi:hypothetical protein